jgi:molybdopterin converting factor subunit 1
MTVTVLLFAAAKDLVGADAVALELPAGGTVGDVKRSLARTHPQVASLLSRCAVAKNQEYADDAEVVAARDELAVIPPVSGG